MFTSNKQIDILVVGLGNPGEKYSLTRHNAGWMVVEELHKTGEWSAWSWSNNGLVSSGLLFGHTAMMLRPLTMMNASGEAVVNLLTTFECPPSHIIVVHDELDIPFSEVRNKFGGGHAGHRGIASVASSLGTQEFHRVRFGIGKPAPGVLVIDHVLTPFTAEESQLIQGTVLAAIQAIEKIVTNTYAPKK